MATEMHWYNSGTWKKANEMHVWDSGIGQWREAVRMYIWDESIAQWRLCHVSPNACYGFNGDYVTGLGDCAIFPFTSFYTNCANPNTDYTSFNCYIYSNSGCTSGVGDAYVQLVLFDGNYNFDTDNTSLIVSAQQVNC